MLRMAPNVVGPAVGEQLQHGLLAFMAVLTTGRLERRLDGYDPLPWPFRQHREWHDRCPGETGQ